MASRPGSVTPCASQPQPEALKHKHFDHPGVLGDPGFTEPAVESWQGSNSLVREALDRSPWHGPPLTADVLYTRFRSPDTGNSLRSLTTTTSSGYSARSQYADSARKKEFIQNKMVRPLISNAIQFLTRWTLKVDRQTDRILTLASALGPVKRYNFRPFLSCLTWFLTSSLPGLHHLLPLRRRSSCYLHSYRLYASCRPRCRCSRWRPPMTMRQTSPPSSSDLWVCLPAKYRCSVTLIPRFRILLATRQHHGRYLHTSFSETSLRFVYDRHPTTRTHRS